MVNENWILRGKNLRLPPCYPDTCVLIDAFLEDPNAPKFTETSNIRNAIDLFSMYQGSMLLTSPMVMAEFMYKAADPKKFGLSYADAKSLAEDIFDRQKFTMATPIIDVHRIPHLQLPFVFNYSMKLSGPWIVKNEVGGNVEMVLGNGHNLMTFDQWAGRVEDILEALKTTRWKTLTLCGVLTDLLLDAAIGSTLESSTPLGFQDALVLYFARGHQFVHFVTSDKEFIKRLKGENKEQEIVKPFPDVEVRELSEYLDKILLPRIKSKQL